MYIDVDDDNIPDWLEVVADISHRQMERLVSLHKLADFPFVKLWMSSPDKPILMATCLPASF